MAALSPQGETVSEAVGLLISEAGSQTWGRWGVSREGEVRGHRRRPLLLTVHRLVSDRRGRRGWSGRRDGQSFSARGHMIGWCSFQSAVSLIGGEPPEATVPRGALVRAGDGQGRGPPGHFHGGEDRPGGPALYVKSSEPDSDIWEKSPATPGTPADAPRHVGPEPARSREGRLLTGPPPINSLY